MWLYGTGPQSRSLYSLSLYIYISISLPTTPTPWRGSLSCTGQNGRLQYVGLALHDRTLLLLCMLWRAYSTVACLSILTQQPWEPFPSQCPQPGKPHRLLPWAIGGVPGSAGEPHNSPLNAWPQQHQQMAHQVLTWIEPVSQASHGPLGEVQGADQKAF